MRGFKEGNKEWMKGKINLRERNKAVKEGRRKYWLRKKYNLPLTKESQNER